MKKLVIFDLDGTLVDSIYDLADCVNLALCKYSLPENTLNEYYAFVGHGMENLVRSAMKAEGQNDELYKKVRAEFDALYSLHCNDKTVPYQGIAQMLRTLSEKGIQTAVLSNKAHRYVGDILCKCFPDHKFSLAWGHREGMHRKPDPQSLFALINEAGYTPSDCVYVGDSDVDVLTAENAGVDLVCVGWGFRSIEQLKASGAKFIAETAEELAEKLISL